MNLKYYLRGLGIGIVVTALLMGFALRNTKEKISDDEIIARAEQLGMVQSGVLSDDLQNPDATGTEDQSEPAEGSIQTDAQADKKDTESENKDAGAEKKAEASGEEIEDNVTVKAAEEAADAKTDVKDTDKKTDIKETGDGSEQSDKKTEADKSSQTAEKKDSESDKKTDTKAESDKKESEAGDNKTENDKKETDKTTTDADKKETDKSTDKSVTVTVRNGDDSLNVANRLKQMGIIKDALAFDDYLCKNGYDKHLATGDHKVKAGMSDKELADALMRSSD